MRIIEVQNVHTGDIDICNEEQLENIYPEIQSGELIIIEAYDVDLSEDVTPELEAHQAIGDALSSVREVASALLCEEKSQSSDGRTDYHKVLLDLCDQIESQLDNL